MVAAEKKPIGAQAIYIDWRKNNESLHGGSDPRKDGYPLGL